MQVARQIALSTKVASRAYGAPFAKNLPLRSGFSGLLRLPPQSPNTQNSSAATPRPGADVRKIFSIKSRNKESEKQKWRICFFKKEKAEPEQFHNTVKIELLLYEGRCKGPLLRHRGPSLGKADRVMARYS